jgi:hypothetical protein
MVFSVLSSCIELKRAERPDIALALSGGIIKDCTGNDIAKGISRFASRINPDWQNAEKSKSQGLANDHVISKL